MEIKKLKPNGAKEIILKPITDDRGFFMRVYDDTEFGRKGILNKWIQENHSKSTQKGIIRGLHIQLPPYTESKLVRCIRGEIFDVFVDLRRNSKNFGKWGYIKLNENNKNMVLIPRGFAHGFCTISSTSEVLYKVDNYYSKQHEIGLLWNDLDLKIAWPTKNPIISEKDRKNITLREFILKYKGI